MGSEPRDVSRGLCFSHNDAVSGEIPSHDLTTESSRNLDNFSEDHVEENENDFGNEIEYSTINLEHLDSFTRDQPLKQIDMYAPGNENVESRNHQLDLGDHNYGIRSQALRKNILQSRILEPIMNAKLPTGNKNEGTTEKNKLESIKTNFSKFLEVIGQITEETVKEVYKNVIEQTLKKTISKVLNTMDKSEKETSDKVICDALLNTYSERSFAPTGIPSEPYAKDDHTNSKHEEKEGKTNFMQRYTKSRFVSRVSFLRFSSFCMKACL